MTDADDSRRSSRRGRRAALWAGVAALIALVIAVGVVARDDATIRPGSDGDAVAAARDELARTKERLPSRRVSDDRGRTVDLADIRGPAAVHVFASWCPSCQGEAATIAELQRRHPELDFYYLNVEDDPKSARRFMARYDWRDGPLLNDEDRSVATSLGLGGQPHTVFIGRDGAMVRHIGPGSFEQLDALASAADAGTDGAR